MKEQEKERLEKKFLEECGFDLKFGYFSEDVDYYKSKFPEIYNSFFK